MLNKTKMEIKVIHLYLFETDKHYYFGSLKALCDTFSKEQLGITYDSLRNNTPTLDRPFRNSKCIIRRGVLVQTDTKRGQKNKSNANVK